MRKASEQQDLHHAMLARDAGLGSLAGSLLGGAGAHWAGMHGLPSALTIGGSTLTGMALGGLVGHERAQADKLRQERHLADRAQAQEHRKELVNMRKKANDWRAAYEAAVDAGMDQAGKLGRSEFARQKAVEHGMKETARANRNAVLGAAGTVGGAAAGAGATHAYHKSREKKATLDGVTLAAMADELQHIHQEKLAINMAGVGNFLGNVGSRAVSGLTSAATRLAPSVGRAATAAGAHSPALGSALGTAGKAMGNAAAHVGNAATAVGGAQNLNRLVGGGLLGGAALGAGGFMAGRATAPSR